MDTLLSQEVHQPTPTGVRSACSHEHAVARRESGVALGGLSAAVGGAEAHRPAQPRTAAGASSHGRRRAPQKNRARAGRR